MLKSLNKVLSKIEKREDQSSGSKDATRQKARKAWGIYDRESFDFVHLVNEWTNIVGEKIAAISAPVKIFNKSLIILTKHSIYSNELKFLEKDIIQKIYKAFPSLVGSIKTIRFQASNNYFKSKDIKLKESLQNDIELGSSHSKLHPMNPEFRALKEKADQAFDFVDDPELKELASKLFVQIEINKK